MEPNRISRSRRAYMERSGVPPAGSIAISTNRCSTSLRRCWRCRGCGNTLSHAEILGTSPQSELAPPRAGAAQPRQVLRLRDQDEYGQRESEEEDYAAWPRCRSPLCDCAPSHPAFPDRSPWTATSSDRGVRLWSYRRPPTWLAAAGHQRIRNSWTAHWTTRYLMWVTVGEATTLTGSSSRRPHQRTTARRHPARSGTTCRYNSSSRPAAMNWAIVLAPPATGTFRSPAAARAWLQRRHDAIESRR